MTKSTSSLVLVIVALLTATVGCRRVEVVRVVEGVQAPGRFISDRAYAAFLIGAEYEARDRYEDALSAYLRAAASDPESVEIRSRIGWLWCIIDRQEEARAAFEEALEGDERYEPAWRRRALCAERRGRLGEALEDAERAVSLDPGRDATVLLYARLLAAAERHEEAWPWLRDLSLRSPASEAVWTAIASQAAGRRPAWAWYARRRLDELRERLGPSLGRRVRTTWQDVDEALLAGDLRRARRRARGAHLDTRLLPARAVVVGRPDLAVRDARVRVEADPRDVGAKIVMALSADLIGEPAQLREALAELVAQQRELDPVSAALFGELLLRHAGPEASRLWLGDPQAPVTVEAWRRRAKDAFERMGRVPEATP